jgi:hypothetical protein
VIYFHNPFVKNRLHSFAPPEIGFVLDNQVIISRRALLHPEFFKATEFPARPLAATKDSIYKP